MFKDAKVKNETSSHNKVACKFYDRLADLLGHRAITNTKDTDGDSSFVVNDNIHGFEENHLEEINTNENNFSTDMESICSQSIVVPPKNNTLLRSSGMLKKYFECSKNFDKET